MNNPLFNIRIIALFIYVTHSSFSWFGVKFAKLNQYRRYSTYGCFDKIGNKGSMRYFQIVEKERNDEMNQKNLASELEALPNLSMTINTSRTSKLRKRLWKERYLFLLLLPGLLYFIVYRYVPMLGNIIAFQDYSPFRGFLNSEWVGLQHFQKIFSDQEVIRVLWNTIYLSFLQIAFAFPIPIVLAIMLNELKSERYKRIVQSILYLPHFLSWVVVIGIATIFLKTEGLVNRLITPLFGIEPIAFLQEPGWFMPLVILEVIWKEAGWGTIIFLASLAGVSPSLYEAAVVDGAGRWRQIWHITLPALRSTIIILLILRLGTVLDSGFEQIFLMLNPFTIEAGNVLDTYVYFLGIQQSDFSFGTAVGLFKSVVGFVLILSANWLAKRFGDEGVF